MLREAANTARETEARGSRLDHRHGCIARGQSHTTSRKGIRTNYAAPKLRIHASSMEHALNGTGFKSDTISNGAGHKGTIFKEDRELS